MEGGKRYIILEASLISEFEKKLSETFSTGALVIFRQIGRAMGMRDFRGLKKLANLTPMQLLRAMAQACKATGVGLVDVRKVDAKRERVGYRNRLFLKQLPIVKRISLFAI